MGSDLVVALGQATADGATLFGQNCHRPQCERQALVRVPGHDFAWGEKVRTQFLDLPQARKTYTALALQPHGFWGYLAGVNERGLAAGCAVLETKLRAQAPGLIGTDLVRLALERSGSARQAADLVMDLIERNGQGPFPECPAPVEGDHALLLADPREAFAIEASGKYWVLQEIRVARAVSDVSVIRQDWNRIAPGLAALAIERNWWPADGSKLDFAEALGTAPPGVDGGLRRWGRATLLLEEQNGHIDGHYFRRLLSDHYEETAEEVDPADVRDGPQALCRHSDRAGGSVTAASLIVSLPADPRQTLRVWCALGPPCVNVYLPILLEAELPSCLGRAGSTAESGSLWWQTRQMAMFAASSRKLRNMARERLAQFQSRIDQEAEAFAAGAVGLNERGDRPQLERRAGFFMQYVVEQFDKTLAELEANKPGTTARPAQAIRVRTTSLPSPPA